MEEYKHIKRLRLERKITLETLAGRVGTTKSQIGRVIK